MGLNLLDIVEIRLPVFHNSVLVGRYQPIVAVGVTCSSYCGFMCLLQVSTRNSKSIFVFATCMINSKLNAIPFHNVNSPLDEAVSNRLPSGVHKTTLMGNLALFRDEWRCLTGMESEARSGRARGGSIYQKVREV